MMTHANPTALVDGRRLRAAMDDYQDRRHASIGDIAKAAGVNDRTIYRWLRGQRSDVYALDQVACLLGMHWSSLTGDDPR